MGNYGEIWVDGKQDRVTGMIQGNNAQQRVEASNSAVPGNKHVIACLAANGPLGEPRAPPRVVIRCRVKLRQVERDQPDPHQPRSDRTVQGVSWPAAGTARTSRAVTVQGTGLEVVSAVGPLTSPGRRGE